MWDMNTELRGVQVIRPLKTSYEHPAPSELFPRPLYRGHTAGLHLFAYSLTPTRAQDYPLLRQQRLASAFRPLVLLAPVDQKSA
jgi:hypothetical protein